MLITIVKIVLVVLAVLMAQATGAGYKKDVSENVPRKIILIGIIMGTIIQISMGLLAVFL